MRKLFSKIKAMFSIGGKGVILDVQRADIKEDKTYLYPANDDEKTYVIKSKSVEILFNDGFDIAEDDFFVIDHKIATARRANVDDIAESGMPPKTDFETDEDILIASVKRAEENAETAHRAQLFIEKPIPYFQKRKFSVTLFGDEVEMMHQAVKEAGMRPADFIMACLQNSQKKSVSRSFATECQRVKHFRATHAKEYKDYYQNIANEPSNFNTSPTNNAPLS